MQSPAERSSSVAVIAPARNAARFFAPWLGSIAAQKYRNLQVILVDDGSTEPDSSAILLARARDLRVAVTLLRQPALGPAAARNLALAATDADYIAFLDLDDLWAHGHLHRLASALDRTPSAGIAQGMIRKFLVEGAVERYFCSEPYRFVNLGACLYRRSVFEQCGVFDPGLRFGEDFDLIVRCWEAGIIKLELPEVSLLYHRHEANMTNGQSIIELGAVRVYKRRLDRLRKGKVDPSLVQLRRVNFADYLGRTTGPFDEGVREKVEA